jgi:hypothetical protein
MEGSMSKVQLAVLVVGTGVGLLAVSPRDAHAVPPAKGATPPMSVQPTQRPVDTAAPAQVLQGPRPAPNSIYVEGLGAGLAYSLNYERLVLDELAVRGGFSYMSIGASSTVNGQTVGASATWMTFPITASYLGIRSSNGKHALELGGGATLTYASASASSLGSSAEGSGMGVLGTTMAGYRLHPVDGAGFNFRVGLMGLVGKGLGLSTPDPTAIGFLPWFYLSLGASF